MENNSNVINPEAEQLPERRRKLLPWWIRFFSWLFMIFGGFAILGLIAGFFNANFEVSLYGLETTNPHSLIGLLIIVLFIFKAITGYSLYFEKDWAILMAKIDAVSGILICTFTMFALPFIIENYGLQLRLEIAILILYLIKINKIAPAWQAITSTSYN